MKNNMKELLERIDVLEQRITEKEDEIQLLKDDLEALRTALEASMEGAEPAPESAQPEPVEESPEEQPKPTSEVKEAQEDATEEEVKEEPESSPGTGQKEQDHEAIIRTIEEFAKQKKENSPVYDGPISSQPTVGDRAAGSKLNDIKKAMGINERFLFANELFNGDMSAFTRAVEELNHLESLGDAEKMLEEELSIKYQWDDESETVSTFKSLVSRRFA